jgi:hypothetical protein
MSPFGITESRSDFRIYPKFKYLSEGDKVVYGDFLLYQVNYGLYLGIDRNSVELVQVSDISDQYRTIPSTLELR